MCVQNFLDKFKEKVEEQDSTLTDYAKPGDNKKATTITRKKGKERIAKVSQKKRKKKRHRTVGAAAGVEIAATRNDDHNHNNEANDGNNSNQDLLGFCVRILLTDAGTDSISLTVPLADCC